MRLLLVTNDYPPKPGGIQQTLANLVDRWSDPVRVLAPNDPAAKSDARVVRHERTFMRPTRQVRQWVEAHVADFRPEVILFGAPHPLAMLGPGLRKRTGRPYVVMTHGAEVTFPAVIPGLRQVLAWSLGSAGTVFAVSQFTAGRVARLSGRSVEVLGAGADIESFHPQVLPTAEGKSSEGETPTRKDRATFTLGCVSRFVPRKGLTRLLRAAAELQARGHRVEVLIVGWGPLEQRMRDLATRLGVPTRFEVNVPWERLPTLYREMDAFVMPVRSRWFGLEIEGLGLCYLEAAATGLPIVAGTSGGAPETVDPGETGFVADSVAGIVEAVEMWLADPATARAMGESGRERIEDHFTWDLVMDRFRKGISAAVE
ncbi:MAG: glycosyltransferase family 4 protein [Acidimicrobiia bacterium]|nr:glycosyltransferase family 4 protein [Acidimicrobiia bacterium]MDH3396229.1 glycosyltransferase family 4 protein [Acidimicrobiia bacterium]